ncbi:MAG: DUF4331 family protein [Myxococcales bacterium]|nr:DUF4331 family protein [Myxococcales bacterium]
MLNKTLLFACGLGLVLALGACSDDSGTKPDTKKPTEAGAETAPPKEAGSEAAPTEAGTDMAVTPIDVDANIAGTQIDRAGRPGISSVLLFGAAETAKDTFNESSPDALKSGAVADGMNALIDTLTGLGTSPLQVNGVDLTAATLKAVLVAGGDVLKVDTAGTTTGYLGVEVGISGAFGGRGLDEDVVNTSLAALTSKAITTDKVDANDVAFKSTFPYLADAH